MINVAICDDDDFFCEDLTSFLKINYSDIIKNIDDFSNGTELIASVCQSDIVYDFIFLDLYMPDGDGIMTGSKLRELNSHINSIIFIITAFDCQVTQITDIHPFAYIKKPLNYSFLKQKIDAAFNQYVYNSKYILIETKKTTSRFIPNDILYFESSGRKSIVHFSNGESHVISISLSDIARIITNEHIQCVRIHTSYIINLIHVDEITHSNVCLKSSATLPISSSYRKIFFKKFREFFI